MQDTTYPTPPTDPDSKNNLLWFFATLFFILSLVEGAVIFHLLGNSKKPASQDVMSTTDTSIPNPLSSPPAGPTDTPAPKSIKKPLNEEFVFPIRNAEGNEISELKFLMKEYEFTNQVVVNNRRATLLGDKIVLVIHTEITNDSEGAFQVFAGDYLRLQIGNSEQLLAPDINDDPLEVRPNSTKKTNLGFSITESDTNIKLLVGEQDGDKETIIIEK